MRETRLITSAGVLSLTATVLLAACGGGEKTQAAAEPAREIQLAPTTTAQPQLSDVPEKTAPKKTAVAKKAALPPRQPKKSEPMPPSAPSVVAPPAPAPTRTGMIDAGTTFAVHPATRVCTSTHKVGDRFTATLNESLQGSNGAAIPAGSAVVLRVVESQRSENSKDSIKLAFDVVSVKVGDETYEVNGRVTQTSQLEKVRVQSTGDQAKKVGAGAAIGAILGQVLGKNTKSTVVGAAVGAAAGGAIAAGTADYDGCLPAAGNITIALDRPLTVKVRASGAGY